MKKQPEIPKGEAYESCDTLPFINFIELSLSGDLKWLIKSGNPQNLEQIHASIQSEYTELSGDKETNSLLELNATIKYYEGRLSIGRNVIGILRTRHVDGLIDVLKNHAPAGLGIMLPFDDLQMDLNRAELILKGEEMRMNKAIGERDEMTGGEVHVATKKHWYARLSAIDKYRQSPPTNPANITTMQYIVMDSDYNTYISYMNEQNAKRSY